MHPAKTNIIISLLTYPCSDSDTLRRRINCRIIIIIIIDFRATLYHSNITARLHYYVKQWKYITQNLYNCRPRPIHIYLFTCIYR